MTDFNGLNLSWEVREGIVKHSSPYDRPLGIIAEFLPGIVPTVEAQIINYADEIAYNNHDIDDGLKSGYITRDQLRGVELWHEVWCRVMARYPSLEQERATYQTISALIGYLISDLTLTTALNLRELNITTRDDLRRVNRQVVGFSSDVARKNRGLKLPGRVGVPPNAPVDGSMLMPGGRPVADQV